MAAARLVRRICECEVEVRIAGRAAIESAQGPGASEPAAGTSFGRMFDERDNAEIRYETFDKIIRKRSERGDLRVVAHAMRPAVKMAVPDQEAAGVFPTGRQVESRAV